MVEKKTGWFRSDDEESYAPRKGIDDVKAACENLADLCEELGLPMLVAVQTSATGMALGMVNLDSEEARPELTMSSYVIENGLVEVGPVELLRAASTLVEQYENANGIGSDVRDGKVPAIKGFTVKEDTGDPN